MLNIFYGIAAFIFVATTCYFVYVIGVLQESIGIEQVVIFIASVYIIVVYTGMGDIYAGKSNKCSDILDDSIADELQAQAVLAESNERLRIAREQLARVKAYSASLHN